MGSGSDYVTPDLPSVFSIGGDFTYANTPHTAHTARGRGSGGDFTYSNLNIIREGRTLPNLEGDLNKCVKRECVKRALPLRLSV